MNFTWSSEQLALRAEIVQFAQEHLSGDVVKSDRDSEFPRAKWERGGEFGLPGLRLPRCYGGRGLDLPTTILALEALGYGCDDNGFSFAVNGQICTQDPLLQFGSKELRDKHLPSLATGKSLISFAFTEPEAGSDLYALTTKATPTEGGYLLSGTKHLISFGPIADLAIVFATTNPERKQWGLTAFLVDLHSEGVTACANNEKMGLRTVPLGELVFDNCFVPGDHLLGKEGAGLGILNNSLEWDRVIICAYQLGAMERQLERCIKFARARKQFDQPIGDFQSVSNRIAEMKLRLETSRLLLYRTAWRKENGESVLLDAALSKLHVAESFVQSGLDAIAIHGGVGYLSEHNVERDLRDAIGGTIYAGTSDIQRNTIAKLLGL